jgi:hypothetical protein
MRKFLVLYNSPIPAAEMMANATSAEAQAGMDAWMDWAKRNGESVVDLGVPLGAGAHISSGSISAASTEATGYSVMQAESLDAAAAMLQDHPHLLTPDGSIDVLEYLPMPGG